MVDAAEGGLITDVGDAEAKEGILVGAIEVGDIDGRTLGEADGALVGFTVGASVGTMVGFTVGAVVVGYAEGDPHR